MASLQSQIEELYKTSLSEFVTARNALAKSLPKADAGQVKALAKPTLVPWAVNQVYWHSRAAYDRLMKSGGALRRAQIAALKGRATELRDASADHRRAIGEAVSAARDLASRLGERPSVDALSSMFEAISLAEHPPEPHGQFTAVLRPAGFEALAGVEVKMPTRRPDAEAGANRSEPATKSGQRLSQTTARKKAEEEREATLAMRRHEAALKRAQADVERARSAEERARGSWQKAKRGLDEAERALAELQRSQP